MRTYYSKNKMSSVLHAPVRLLTMNFVITLSKPKVFCRFTRLSPGGCNVMAKFIINKETDACQTEVNLLNSLFTHHTVPARTPETTVFILSMSLVNTDAAKPYMVLLALSISSFMSLNFMICITGPKIYHSKTKNTLGN